MTIQCCSSMRSRGDAQAGNIPSRAKRTPERATHKDACESVCGRAKSELQSQPESLSKNGYGRSRTSGRALATNSMTASHFRKPCDSPLAGRPQSVKLSPNLSSSSLTCVTPLRCCALFLPGGTVQTQMPMPGYLVADGEIQTVSAEGHWEGLFDVSFALSQGLQHSTGKKARKCKTVAKSKL